MIIATFKHTTLANFGGPRVFLMLLNGMHSEIG